MCFIDDASNTMIVMILMGDGGGLADVRDFSCLPGSPGCMIAAAAQAGSWSVELVDFTQSRGICSKAVDRWHWI